MRRDVFAMRLKALPARQWLLLAVFLLAALGSVFFATRFVVKTIYWSAHREEPIESWMPIRYIAHSHDVEAAILFEALDLPPGHEDRQPIGEIAEREGLTVTEVKARLDAAIAAARLEAATQPAGPRDPETPR